VQENLIKNNQYFFVIKKFHTQNSTRKYNLRIYYVINAN